MYPEDVRREALVLLSAGHTLSSVSRHIGVSRAAIREWRDVGVGARRLIRCPRCLDQLPDDEGGYAYLLGLYLGDGCLSLAAKGVYSFRISCDAKYPGIIDSAEAAMQAVKSDCRVFRVPAPGCVVVQSYWKHWVCLFPQHGPGRKHLRAIVLEDWQREIVQRHPGALLRGLFHSDGCRITNWTTRMVGGEKKRYEYPRYLFVNASEDIIGICCWALDLLDIPWRRARERMVAVSRREAVAALDVHVGPKS